MNLGKLTLRSEYVGRYSSLTKVNGVSESLFVAFECVHNDAATTQQL